MSAKLGFMIAAKPDSDDKRSFDEALEQVKGENVIVSVPNPKTENIVAAVSRMNIGGYRVVQCGIQQGTNSTGELLIVFEQTPRKGSNLFD